MANDWTRVSLGELLRLERRPVKVIPDQQYAEIGTYSFGRGIFHKQPRSGLEVGNKDLFLIKEGDFILQITFAWEGAVALASSAENNMYGSVRFPTFRVDESRCYPQFLVYYFKTQEGLFQLGKISPGSAGRNRVLSLPRIPQVSVPLPSLTEQQRIVARVNALARRVEEARGLRRAAVEEAEAIIGASLAKEFERSFEKYVAFPEIIKRGTAQVRASECPGEIYLSLEDIESNTGRILNKRTVSEAGVFGTAVRFNGDSVLFSKLRPYLKSGCSKFRWIRHDRTGCFLSRSGDTRQKVLGVFPTFFRIRSAKGLGLERHKDAPHRY